MYENMCPDLIISFPTCSDICPVISLYEMVHFENVFKTKIYTPNNFPITHIKNAHLNISAGDIWDFYTKFCDLSLPNNDSNKTKHNNGILRNIMLLITLIYLILAF